MIASADIRVPVCMSSPLLWPVKQSVSFLSALWLTLVRCRLSVKRTVLNNFRSLLEEATPSNLCLLRISFWHTIPLASIFALSLDSYRGGIA